MQKWGKARMLYDQNKRQNKSKYLRKYTQISLTKFLLVFYYVFLCPQPPNINNIVNRTEAMFFQKKPKRGLPEVDENKSAGVVGRNQLTESTRLKAD